MKVSPILLGLSLAVAGGSMAAAQDAASTSSVPLVLQITREFTKPYKGGMAHDNTESAFIAAMTKAKFPVYYVAMNSMSGKSRALFITRYTSFEEWEKDNKLADKTPGFNGDLERASLADGELLEEVDSGVFTYDADLSYHPHNDLQNHHFYQISEFHVRPGHHKEWLQAVRMVKDAYDKIGTSKAHWGTYEVAFGAPDGTYLVFTGDPSMSAIDEGMAENKKFVEAMGGQEGMAKFDELFGAAVDSSISQLFSVNPKQSYVSADWIKADPAFWKPKSTAAPKAAAATSSKPPAAKPASR